MPQLRHAYLVVLLTVLIGQVSCSNLDQTVQTSSIKAEPVVQNFAVKAKLSNKIARDTDEPRPVVIARATQTTPRTAKPLGSAPWICSPSGFGATARCYAR